MRNKTRRQEHADDTRAAILAAARYLFGRQGYEATLTEDVVKRARVTRGALYHHFNGKEDLFRQVFESVEGAFVTELASRAGERESNWDQFCEGCLAFLDLSLEPAYRQIMMIDGPAVLGWETWREIDAQFGFGLLRDSLAGFIDQGIIDPQPVDALAHLLIGALTEGVMAIAKATDRQEARDQVGRALMRLLTGLRTPASPQEAAPTKPQTRRRT